MARSSRQTAPRSTSWLTRWLPERSKRSTQLRIEGLEDRVVPAIVSTIPDWVPSGPAPAINGQVTNLGNPVTNEVSGAVQSAVPHPRDVNVLFAGGVNGGVWRTTNALAASPNWTPLTDQLPSQSISSMTVNPDRNPDNPNVLPLLAGIGGFSSAFGIAMDKIGLLYTPDAMAPNPIFRVIQGPFVSQQPDLNGQYPNVSSVVMRTAFRRDAAGIILRDPNGRVISDTYMLVVGDNGVYRSTDNGVTFVELSGAGGLPTDRDPVTGNLPPIAGRLTNFEAISDPFDPRVVYVTGQAGVFRTDDILATTPTWVNITGSLAGRVTNATQRIRLAIHDSPAGNGQRNNVVYIATANPGSNPATSQMLVSWSTNRGGNWVDMDEAYNLSSARGITAATLAAPIAITTAGNHGLQTGDRVVVEGLIGLSPNTAFQITVTGANTFTLDGSAGTGVYTGGATYRQVFGVAPGGQADIHMSLAADPFNPNLVYVGGDRQNDTSGLNSVGAVNFTGNVMRGDRTIPRKFGFIEYDFNFAQFRPITDSFSGNGGAPHADSRTLAFDANGDLIEGDDGGIYKRANPRSNSGVWSSLNGNIALSQIYQIRQDTVNNALFAGTQDTATVEQFSQPGTIGIGSTTWNTVFSGDGFWQSVDNISAPNRSIRYSMFNTVEAFVRREFDGSGNLVSTEFVRLAAPDDPDFYEGLDAADKGSFGLNVFSINKVDGRLMMLGITKLYEDDDPAGRAGDVIANVTPTNFAGKTTAIEYGGRQLRGVNSATGQLEYQDLVRIAYVGMDNGDLWIRGAADGFNNVRAALDKAAPLDPNNPLLDPAIQDVVLDPDDWRTAYVLRDNRVLRTTDAGLSFTDLTANLVASGWDEFGNPVGGLTNRLLSLTLWNGDINVPGTENGVPVIGKTRFNTATFSQPFRGDVLIVGGNNGVFRYVPQVGGTSTPWIGYGAGLPTSLAFDLQVYDFFDPTGKRISSSLAVGTQGRGAFEIADIIPTIDKRAVVTVVGTAGPDLFSLTGDPSNPAYVVVGDGATTVRYARTSVQAFQFNGGAGADTLILAANGQLGGDLSFVRYPIEIDMGGDVGDRIEVRSLSKATATNVTFDTTVRIDPNTNLPVQNPSPEDFLFTFGFDPADNLFDTANGGRVTYKGLEQGTLVLDLANDANRNAAGRLPDGVLQGPNIVNVRATAARTVQVLGGIGQDVITVNSKAGTSLTDGNLKNLFGDFEYYGRVDDRLIPGTKDKFQLAPPKAVLNVSDFSAKTGNADVVVGNELRNGVTVGLIGNVAGPNDAGSIRYLDVLDVNLTGSNSAELAESYRINNPVSKLTLRTLDGPDAINLRANQLAVAIYGGAGDDLIRVSSLAGDSDEGDLSGILGPVTIDAEAGNNRLIVSDFGSPIARPLGVYRDAIVGTFDALGQSSPIYYLATGGRFNNGGSGDGILIIGSAFANDTINVQSTLAGSQTAVDGSDGNDRINVATDQLSGELWIRGGRGDDTIEVFAGILGLSLDLFRVTGGDGKDELIVNGFNTDDNLTFNVSGGGAGTVTGLFRTISFDATERVTADGRAGRNNLTINDATNKSYGTPTNPGSGIVFQPMSYQGGEVRIGGGTVLPIVGFRNINGSDASGLVINGDPFNNGTRDVLTVLATSDQGIGNTGPLTDLTSRNGTDTIDVSDRGVVIVNRGVGPLRAVALGRAGARNSFTSLVVLGGNETTQGDTFRVVPSKELNIVVDGQLPSRQGTGNAVEVNTAVPYTLAKTNDPSFGPPQVRVTTSDGASFGYVNIARSSGQGGVGTGSGGSIYAVGADAGGGPRVRVYDSLSEQVLFDRFVYNPSFLGGVRVATGDVNGDGIPDIITGAGQNGGPHVQVFDGLTFNQIASFFAYESTFTGGIYVTVADVNNDGVGEIITGTGVGGGPLLRVFDGTGKLLTSAFPFESTFRGGVRVAAGDVNGDGRIDLIATAGPGGGAVVRALDPLTLQPVLEYIAFDPNYRGGLFVTAGDMDGDGIAEVAVAPGIDVMPEIRVRRGINGQELRLVNEGFLANDELLNSTGTASGITGPFTELGGIRLAMTDYQDQFGDQKIRILAGRGPGTVSKVFSYVIDPVFSTGSLLAFEDSFTGGIFVG